MGSDTMLRARGKRKWFTGAMTQQQVKEPGQTVSYSSSAGKHQTQISFRTIFSVWAFRAEFHWNSLDKASNLDLTAEESDR